MNTYTVTTVDGTENQIHATEMNRGKYGVRFLARREETAFYPYENLVCVDVTKSRDMTVSITRRDS